MHSQIFVNLPVKDLKRAVDFYTSSATPSIRSSPTRTPPA
jgi:hypothetical protein